MRRFLIAAVLVALTASFGEARCKRFGKGRVRHAVHRVADAPFKVAGAVTNPGVCPGGVCR